MVNHDYIVIGAGAAGLVVAIGLAAAKKDVVLVEKGTYGGDCTNFGCIPSKALISRAELVHHGATISSEEALSYTRDIVAQVFEHETPDALAQKGVPTLTGEAHFIDAHTLQVGEQTLRGKTIVIATGSTPLTPPLDGLDSVDYLTNETIFNLDKAPESLIVLGGGPIGCELAQAFARLGSKVAVVQSGDQILGREEPEACATVANAFQREGIALYTGTRATNVRQEEQVILTVGEEEIYGDRLLVATGRKPHIDTLQLENAGIRTEKGAIVVDAHGRTSAKNVFAIGDATGPPFFTHRAEHHARTLVFNLLVPIFNKKIDKQAMPRCTFTDPEVASIGLTHAQAVAQYGEKKIKTYRVPLSEVDRAIAAGRTDGFVSITTRRLSSKILGATVVGPRAGEILMQISTAMFKGIPLRSLSTLIHPYPIYGQAVRKCADGWLKQILG